jgi:hypothetical protein
MIALIGATAEWLDAWREWTAMVRKLRQQAKYPEPVSTPEFVNQERDWHQ